MSGNASTRPDIPAGPLVMPQDEFALVRKLADATKACGCGPLEPCKPHLGAGDLPDWEGRARAAEAKLDAERRAFHGILIRFAAEAARGKWAHGLPGEWPSEALRRIAVDLKKAAGEMAAASLRDEEPAALLTAVCTGPDCGTLFADSETGEYEFATRERMERLLSADGWQAGPPLCPACQPEEADRG